MEHIKATHAFADHLGQEMNTRITNLAVSFMNTADVIAAVTVLGEFSNSNCNGSVGIYGVWKANKFLNWMYKSLSMEFRISTEYFLSIPLSV